MTEKNLGSAPIVREGEAAFFARRRDLVEELGPPPCFVRYPDAGGLCERSPAPSFVVLASLERSEED